MYVNPNFKTKRAFKEAFASGKPIDVFSPFMFPPKYDGTEFIEGPHFPKPHKWYASVTMKNGKIVSIK
jgi:hypothetical protein